MRIKCSSTLPEALGMQYNLPSKYGVPLYNEAPFLRLVLWRLPSDAIFSMVARGQSGLRINNSESNITVTQLGAHSFHEPEILRYRTKVILLISFPPSFFSFYF